MNFEQVQRFAHASTRALAQAGTDNRATALIELAWPDWREFLRDASREIVATSPHLATVNVDHIGEVRLYGCIIRPKADTIPASVAFGAALSELPKLSLAAGCYTGVTVIAMTGADPRTKL